MLMLMEVFLYNLTLIGIVCSKRIVTRNLMDLFKVASTRPDNRNAVS